MHTDALVRENGRGAGIENAVPQDATDTLPRLETKAIPVPKPRPIPVPLPWLLGSRFHAYKQDPTVGEPGLRTLYVGGLILNGPLDARIRTELTGTTPVPRNAAGDFIFPAGTPQFDCAHTWAVVRGTLTMFQRLRGGVPIPWAWNNGGDTDALTVHPRAGATANAYYSRTARALKFFYFTPSGATSHVFTCRSLDIVAHETGHAVLDGLKPGWLSSAGPPQTGGLHESFGDLSAIFLALSQLDQAEAVIALSKANLHAKTFLSALAEQFGAGLGLPFGLRNADNDLKLSQVGNEVHAISQVFTGGIYDMLADVYAYERNRQRATKDPALVLVEVAEHVAKLVLDGIIAAPATPATYADVVNKMLVKSQQQGDPAIYRTFLRNRFTVREVVVSPTPLTDLLTGAMDMADPDYGQEYDGEELQATDIPATMTAEQDRSMCCGTLQLPETRLSVEELATGTAFSDDDLLATEYKRLQEAFG